MFRLLISGLFYLGLAACSSSRSPSSPSREPSLILSEFLFQNGPSESCHASTIAETRAGLVVAWYGGTWEGNPDVAIWTSLERGRKWGTPVRVADGLQPDGKTRYPCWNPVLHQSTEGPLLLFYKVGPRPSRWWGMLTTSADGGKTWSKPRHLSQGYLGPVRNKPVLLADGSLLCGASTEDRGWRVHLERTPDLGASWERTSDLNEGSIYEAIQPTLLCWPSGRIQLLARTKQGEIAQSWMGQDWKAWSPMEGTGLPNPDSAVDAVVLKDGRGLLIYNHADRARSPLNAAVSTDGKNWWAALVLEDDPGEYSYPAVIQTRDQQVHVSYTWRRKRIKHIVIDPAKIKSQPIIHGRWPG